MHGTVWETDGLRVEEVHVAPGTRLRGHGHDHPHLCYIETGAFAERDVGGWRSVAGGTLRSSPAGDEHDIRFETNTTCLLVLFEGAPLAASPAFPGSRHYSEQPRVRELGGALARSLHRAPLSTFEIGTVALELLAAGCPTTTPRTPPPWLHRVRERLLDDPARPPDTTELAEVTGVHPVYVARAFRSHYGVGLGEFARIARAERARGLINSNDTPLARLAVRAGYADQSHMTRELRRVFGMTPGRLRKAAEPPVEVASFQDF